jgi:hypothetical protein
VSSQQPHEIRAVNGDDNCITTVTLSSHATDIPARFMATIITARRRNITPMSPDISDKRSCQSQWWCRR